MGTLVGAEADGPPFTLTGSRLYCGFYLNELLVRLLPRHDPYPALQGHYRAAVGGLAAGEPVDVCLRLFEMRLLAALGYGLALALDSGAAVDPDREYYYVQEQGPQLTVPASAPFVTVQGATLLALQGMDLTAPAVQAEAKRLLRFALAPYLGERPLASRALFSKVLLR
jgi:DNA repair protein RecO (recombination protein O)